MATKEVFLSELLSERRERATSSGLPVWSVSNQFGFVLPSRIFNKTIASKDTKNYKKVFPQDFAYNPSRINIGSLALNNSQEFGIVSPMYVVFSITDPNILDPRYLLYFLKSPQGSSSIIHNVRGGVRFQLKFADLVRIKIKLPNLSEQRRIIDLMENVEKLKQNQRDLGNKMSATIPALFNKMFGDPQLNPKGWPVKKIGELLVLCEYGTSKKAHTSNVGTPMLRMNNVTSTGDLTTEDLKYAEFTEKELKKFELNKGDVLFNRTNSRELVGKTGVWDGRFRAVAASYFIRLRFDQNKENPIHFGILMNLPHMKRILLGMARGAVGQANINAKELSSISIPVPPLKLQNEFVDKLGVILTVEAKHKQSTEKIDTLSFSIFSQAFSAD